MGVYICKLSVPSEKVVLENKRERTLTHSFFNPEAKLHNPDGPARITYDLDNGRKLSEEHFILSREGWRIDEPSAREWDRRTGRLIREEYRTVPFGLNRSNGPAEVLYSGETGEVLRQQWYRINVERRYEERPSFWERDETTGVIVKERYCDWGRLHRLDGPALIERDRETGEILHCEWHIDGVRIPDQSDTNFESFSPPTMD